MDCSESCGGKVMVFGGDFRQVLPVVPRGTRAQITDATIAAIIYMGQDMEDTAQAKHESTK